MNEIIEKIQVEKEINGILIYELKNQQDLIDQILQSLNKFSNDQTDELTENQHQNNLTKLHITIGCHENDFKIFYSWFS